MKIMKAIAPYLTGFNEKVVRMLDGGSAKPLGTDKREN